MPKPTDEKHFNFTKAALINLESPDKGRIYYYDDRQPGLSICVTAAGGKTFYVYRWANGKPMRMRLGTFPVLTVDQARKMTQQAVAEVAQGKNPAEEKQAKRKRERGEITLQELFDWFLEHHAKPHKKPSSVAEDERLFKRYLDSWNSHRISTIKRSDVRTLHAKIGRDNGKYAANRMLSLLGTMFSKAIDADDLTFEGANPTRGITRFDEKSRDRYLQGSELPAFFKALDEEPNQTMRDFFLVLLLTGARRGNVLSMAWADVELENSVWRIPDTKANESQTVHLSAEAVHILTARQESAGKCPWVFPAGRSDSNSGHLCYPSKAWERICSRANLQNLRIHDLRRTLGSWQAATGASLPVIGKSLGHKNQATTAIYARLNLDPIRESVDKATAAMMAAGQSNPQEHQAKTPPDGSENPTLETRE